MKAHQNAVARRQYFSGCRGPEQAGPARLYHEGHERATVPATAGSSTSATAGPTSGPASRRRRSPVRAATSRTSSTAFSRSRRWPAGCENAEPEGPPKSWSLKMGMWGAKRYGQGLMVVGDAGSMVHPISGEGVGYALESGRLAAILGPRGARQSRFLRLDPLRLRAPTQTQSGPGSTSRATRWSTWFRT